MPGDSRCGSSATSTWRRTPSRPRSSRPGPSFEPCATYLASNRGSTASSPALQAATIGSAYALGDESRRGHLAPGALGDVTILSGDVTDATADEIRAMNVIATIVGGVIEYCGDPAICAQGGE